jgi:hypothetical protein
VSRDVRTPRTEPVPLRAERPVDQAGRSSVLGAEVPLLSVTPALFNRVRPHTFVQRLFAAVRPHRHADLSTAGIACDDVASDGHRWLS